MSAAKHQPATPLPWRIREKYGRDQLCVDGSPEGAGDPDKRPVADVTYAGANGCDGNAQNAEYLAHTANAYPELVEALRDLFSSNAPEHIERAKALLRKLGEAP
jgi:hypothetical protein